MRVFFAEAQAILLRQREVPVKEKFPSMHEEPSLGKALWKLTKFSQSIQDQSIGKDAKKVTQRIAGIIKAVQQQSHPHNDLESRNHDLDDFENIDDCLSVSRRVDVNKGFQRSGHSKHVRTARRRNTATSGSWKIVLTTTTVKSRHEDGSDIIKSLYSLCLEPQSPAAGHPVQDYFGVIEHSQRSFLPPVVFAYRIIPNDSKVFDVIEQDDLQSLRELIENGTVTMWDCDEENRSLLHYACYYKSSQCCEYLIKRGADVERHGRKFFLDSRRTTTPLLECFTNLDEDPRNNICSRLLLRAGADPTIDTHESSSPLMHVMGNNTPKYLDLLCAVGGELFNLRIYKEGITSQSLWLRASGCHQLPILRRLFSGGCDVLETDADGHNCILCFFLDYDLGDPFSSLELEALLFLLRVFKDIHTRDKRGCTVFDHVDDLTDEYGSYTRDLWYCALDRAGFDVSDHLAQHPRVSTLTMYYTPEHYYALKHLDSWDYRNFRSQMDALLEKIPLSHEEAL